MKICVLKIHGGTRVHEYLEEYIRKEGLRGGLILGIGGLEYARVGYFKPETREYITIELKAEETVLEVSSLLGNYLVKPDGSISIHIHVTLGTRRGVYAGHLLSGIAQPFLEVFLVETGEEVKLVFNHR